MSSSQAQVSIPFLDLCVADFGDALKTSSTPRSTPSLSSNEELVMVYLELSVRFEELCEEFNHLIECHWAPL